MLFPVSSTCTRSHLVVSAAMQPAVLDFIALLCQAMSCMCGKQKISASNAICAHAQNLWCMCYLAPLSSSP